VVLKTSIREYCILPTNRQDGKQHEHKIIHCFFLTNPEYIYLVKGRDHLEDLGIAGTITLQQNLGKYGGKLWTQFNSQQGQ
jgi:hypothetical protein